jgi:hypothetical protein
MSSDKQLHPCTYVHCEHEQTTTSPVQGVQDGAGPPQVAAFLCFSRSESMSSSNRSVGVECRPLIC